MGRYNRKTLPCRRTISTLMAALGFRPQKVQKCLPLKKIPETDAIFKSVHYINAEADVDPNGLRISLESARQQPGFDLLSAITGYIYMSTETRSNAAMSSLPSPYEDRFRLLSRDAPLVAKKNIGEIYAVFYGVGSASKGDGRSPTMADCLAKCFTESAVDFADLLYDTNRTIHRFGLMIP